MEEMPERAMLHPKELDSHGGASGPVEVVAAGGL